MMKKTVYLITMLCFLTVPAFADTITKPNTFVNGNIADADEVNENFDTVYDQVNKISGSVSIGDDGNVGIGTSSIVTISSMNIKGVAGTTHDNGILALQPGDGWGDPRISFYDVNGNLMNSIMAVCTGQCTPENLDIWNYQDAYIRFGTQNTERVRITGDGNVGIGTNSPSAPLHIEKSDAAYLTVKSTGKGGATLGDVSVGNYGSLILSDSDENEGVILNAAGYPSYIKTNLGIGMMFPDSVDHPLQMASGAYCSSSGVWTDASSREYKDDIRGLSETDAISALNKLEPVKFYYKADKQDEHVGFIAEDVPDLVASKGRKGLSPMDIVAVLTKVVQQQQKKIEDLEAKINSK